jgi:hypothetical protein
MVRPTTTKVRPAVAQASIGSPAISVRGITNRFGAVTAVDVRSTYPGAAGSAIVGVDAMNLLAPGTAALILGVFVVVASMTGAGLMRRRDVPSRRVSDRRRLGPEAPFVVSRRQMRRVCDHEPHDFAVAACR